MQELGFTTKRTIDIHRDSARISIIGVGGAGRNSIGHIITSHLPEAIYHVIETDRTERSRGTYPSVLFIGEDPTGTSGSVEKGEIAAREASDSIFPLIAGKEITFLVAGLGGGTGTGVLRAMKKITGTVYTSIIPIVFMPFTFEGNKRVRVANETLEMIDGGYGIYAVIYNERIFKGITSSASLKSMFIEADLAAQTAIGVISNMLTIERETPFRLIAGKWSLETDEHSIGEIVFNRS